MFKEKPVISNQHGALAMAMLPFLYAVIESGFSTLHIFFGLSWLFLYFFSYPFLSLFSKKPTERNKKMGENLLWLKHSICITFDLRSAFDFAIFTDNSTAWVSASSLRQTKR